MRSENDSGQPRPFTGLSLRKLAEYAISEELIDRLDIDGERVIILQGDNRFVLPPRQASTFLIGMLRGRSWFIDDGARDLPTPYPVTDGEDRRPPTVEDGSETQALDATLESLLTFTQEVGIINGFMKDEYNRKVRIDISACSTDLSYLEALGYLFDCVQHEMRSMKGRN